MYVSDLKLNNYRNYSSVHFTFHPELNIIIGNNGIGKTNILESIILTSNTRSFRTSKDQDLIKEGTEYARVEVLSDAGRFRTVINKSGKTLTYNDIPVKKASDFIGKLNAVLFKPNDLELFSSSPKDRRRLLDLELGQISPNYLRALLTYNVLLKDKNRLLKEMEPDQTLLELIEEAMVPQIRIILEERKDFFNFINEKLTGIYDILSGTDDPVSVNYRACSSTDTIAECLVKSKDRDLYYHYATYGPHHEDYSFKMKEKDLESIASQGQRRMVLIAFKFALIEYIREKTGTMPVVLLDDILSELDQDNRQRLLDHLPQGQVIITDTDIKDIQMKKDYKLIHLKEERNG